MQMIVAGLAFGVVAGLALHVVLADPALLTGARPAYAESGAQAAGETATDRGSTAAAESADGEGASAQAEAAGTPVAQDPTRRLPTYARERYHYASLGRRDPFQQLVGGTFEASGDVGLPDVADLRLVGIAWDEADRFAMAEDSRGYGYVLRLGDKVRGGRVAGIHRDSVTFAQYTAGALSTITLELPIREDES
jgi:hypothetical protein